MDLQYLKSTPNSFFKYSNTISRLFTHGTYSHTVPSHLFTGQRSVDRISRIHSLSIAIPYPGYSPTAHILILSHPFTGQLSVDGISRIHSSSIAIPYRGYLPTAHILILSHPFTGQLSVDGISRIHSSSIAIPYRGYLPIKCPHIVPSIC